MADWLASICTMFCGTRVTLASSALMSAAFSASATVVQLGRLGGHDDLVIFRHHIGRAGVNGLQGDVVGIGAVDWNHDLPNGVELPADGAGLTQGPPWRLKA